MKAEEIYNLFDEPASSKNALLVGMFMFFVILLSSITYCFETLPAFLEDPPPDCGEGEDDDCIPKPVPAFAVLEALCVAIFTGEYIVRLATSHAAAEWGEGSAFVKTCRYVRSPLNLIDLVAILPSYLEWLSSGAGDLAVLRILRLARVLRIFKIAKFNADLQVLHACIHTYIHTSTHA